ncbi:MAG: hypothetical protein ABWK53_13255 [Anaerolineales bacterium]
MSKKSLLLLLTVPLLLACRLSSQPPRPTKTPAPSPTPSPPPTATSHPAQQTNAYTLVYIHRSEGGLGDLLAEHARLAAGLGQEPVAYFTAPW